MHGADRLDRKALLGDLDGEALWRPLSLGDADLDAGERRHGDLRDAHGVPDADDQHEDGAKRNRGGDGNPARDERRTRQPGPIQLADARRHRHLYGRRGGDVRGRRYGVAEEVGLGLWFSHCELSVYDAGGLAPCQHHRMVRILHGSCDTEPTRRLADEL